MCAGIQKAQFIVDTPCSEMHTDAFIEVRPSCTQSLLHVYVYEAFYVCECGGV